jgi:hypothetical protein
MKQSTLPDSRKYHYPCDRFVRTLLKAGIGLGVKLLTRTQIIGRENLPDEEPLIVVANHFHFFDSVILILSVPWFMEFLADFEMPNVPFPLKIFPKLYQTYDVAQGTPNLEVLRASEAILAQDGVLGIYSEDDWKLFGILIEEKRRLWATCQFGEVFGPLTCKPPRRPSREAINRAGDRIMSEIAKLLPERMRGDFTVNAES